MQAALHHALVALRRAGSVVVCAHVRPDGDAIASVLGMTLALRENGIPAIPTLADARPAPATYEWLPGHALYVQAEELAAPQVFIALDTPNPERLGVARPLMEAAETVIVMDHHPDAQEYGTHHVLDRDAAATGQLVWALAREMGTSPSAEVALCCYTALLTDTGRFQFQNTTPRALRDAAEMLEAGVDASEVGRLVYQERSAASLAVEARAGSRLTIANNGRVAYTWVDDADFAETGALPEEAEHLPEVVRQVGGIDVAVLLRQRGGDVRGNLRAKGGFDVGAVARSFGGGGHAAAAGFTVEGSTVDDVMSQLLPLLPGAGA